MPHPHHVIDVWSVEGQFQQLIYSPKGAIEGVLIDTDGIVTQFVVDPHDAASGDLFSGLKVGQRLVIEGTEAEPSPKGDPLHSVYRFERLASIDGRETGAPLPEAAVSGTVVRFNYAKHGAANGVVLDNGDFIHTRPEGFDALGLKVGDKVRAEGAFKPLVTGQGRVVEAHHVNGKPIGPAH